MLPLGGLVGTRRVVGHGFSPVVARAGSAPCHGTAGGLLVTTLIGGHYGSQADLGDLNFPFPTGVRTHRRRLLDPRSTGMKWFGRSWGGSLLASPLPGRTDDRYPR